ncbi:MAG: hypothetical protein M1816_001924 [Peltula sp. TS41687]|nr:MAG: hypothetical protein M1816_001924 [Peltula sp. TS41687]
MSYDDNASGAWRSGLAPVLSHEFPLDQERDHSAPDRLTGTPLDNEVAKLGMDDVSSEAVISPVAEHQLSSLGEKQDVTTTATILPSPSELDHASEKTVHGYVGPAEDLMEAKKNNAFPAFFTSTAYEEHRHVSRVEHAPLLAHECLGSSAEEDAAMISSVPSISLTALDDSSDRLPEDSSSMEKFPTDGKGIIDFIKMTERRLSEDLTSDDGSRMSSPPHMPTTPVDAVFSTRPRSASSELRSPRLDNIPEEYDLDEEMDTPDQMALDLGSKPSPAALARAFETPLHSPVMDSVSGASLLGHEILLPPNEDVDSMEGLLYCHSQPLLAHETAGQFIEDDVDRFPSQHDASGEMTTSDIASAGGLRS